MNIYFYFNIIIEILNGGILLPVGEYILCFDVEVFVRIHSASKPIKLKEFFIS